MQRTKYNSKEKVVYAMLKELALTNNRKDAIFCKRILRGQKTIQESRKICGLFFKAVLEGDYSTAMARANIEQFYLLENLPYKRVKMTWGYKYVLK